MQDLRQDLAEQVRSGDKSAVEQAYDAYFTPVINFAYYILYDYDAASDISQEAFLRTVEACRDKKKKVRDFKSYLFATARNLAMDQINRRGKLSDVPPESLSFEDPNIFADPARAAMLAEQRASVAAATMRLNEHQRVALTLKDIEGWSYDEIGGFMGLSRNAVGVLLSRARLKFKKEFRLQEIDAGRLGLECRDLLGIMSAYIDGEATDEERRMVAVHLQNCPQCRAVMDEMAGASTSLRSMIPVIPLFALRAALITKATAVGVAGGVAAGVGMGVATKAIVGIVASLMVAGVGVGTYVGVKKVTSSAPAPTVKVIRPLDGTSLAVEGGAGNAGKVNIALAVDNKPTAVELAIDGQMVKRFVRGPYTFEWTTSAQGAHTLKPTAFDGDGKAHPGTAATFTLAIKAPTAERIAFEDSGDIFTVGFDGAGKTKITSVGNIRDFATSPSNGQIAFTNVTRIMYLMNPDGSGVRQVTLPEKGKVGKAAFSYDGKYIYFSRDVTEPGDPDYRYHVHFERYDIAANKVDTIFRKPEAFEDDSVGGLFTDPSGDYLYYNHYGSDFPSSRVFRISLKGTPTDQPFLDAQRGIPGTEVVNYRLESISADGSQIAFEREAAMTVKPPPGSPGGQSIIVTTCLRPTAGGAEKVLGSIDAGVSTNGAIDQVQFSNVDPNRYYLVKKSQPDVSQAVFNCQFFTGTLNGEPVATGFTGTNWSVWHIQAVPAP